MGKLPLFERKAWQAKMLSGAEDKKILLPFFYNFYGFHTLIIKTKLTKENKKNLFCFLVEDNLHIQGAFMISTYGNELAYIYIFTIV